MKVLEEFKKVVLEFSDVADFVYVYTAEGHPIEGWRIKDNFVISQHKSMEDRLQAAQILASLDPVAPIVVDTLEDEALVSYAAFPDRLYIVLDDHVAYEGKIGPWGYNLEEIRDWLNAWKGQSSG